MVNGQDCNSKLRAEKRATKNWKDKFTNCSQMLQTSNEESEKYNVLLFEKLELDFNVTQAKNETSKCIGNLLEANEKLNISKLQAINQTLVNEDLNKKLLTCEIKLDTNDQIANITQNTMENQIKLDADKKIELEHEISVCQSDLNVKQERISELEIQVAYLKLQLNLYNASNNHLGITDQLLLQPKLFFYVLQDYPSVATLIFGPYAAIFIILMAICIVILRKRCKNGRWKKPTLYPYNRKSLPFNSNLFYLKSKGQETENPTVIYRKNSSMASTQTDVPTLPSDSIKVKNTVTDASTLLANPIKPKQLPPPVPIENLELPMGTLSATSTPNSTLKSRGNLEKVVIHLPNNESMNETS